MKCFLTYIILFSISLSSSAVNWTHSFELASSMAELQNKLILVDFYADWCAPCKQMDFQTWETAEVEEQLSRMIPTKINIDVHTTMALEYKIKSIPAIYIMDYQGNVLYKSVGFKRKLEIIHLLSGFPETVEGIYSGMKAIEKAPKEPDYYCELSESFQSYAQDSEGQAKKIFVNECKQYIKKAEKLYKKQQNDLGVEHTCLLELFNAVILGNDKQVIKKLDKMGIDNFHSVNKEQALYIYALAYMNLGNEEKAAKSLNQLKQLREDSNYLQLFQTKFDRQSDNLSNSTTN